MSQEDGEPEVVLSRASRKGLRRTIYLLTVIIYLHEIPVETLCDHLEVDEMELQAILDGVSPLRLGHIGAVLELAGITYSGFYNAVYRHSPPGTSAH